MGPFVVVVLIALFFIGAGNKIWESTANSLVRVIAATLFVVGLYFMAAAFIVPLQQAMFQFLETGIQPTSPQRVSQANSTTAVGGLPATTPTNFVVSPPTIIKTPTAKPTIGTQGTKLDVDAQGALIARDVYGDLWSAFAEPTRVFGGGIISSAAWSPEGKAVLVAFNMQTIGDSGSAPTFYMVFHIISRLQIVSPVSSPPYTIVEREYDNKYVDNRGSSMPDSAISDAIWSPEGQRVALSYTNEAANRCPVVMNADSSGLRKLTNCEADDHPRYWSVDGKWIVVWSERSPALYAYEVDGSRRVQLSQLGKIPVYDERYYPWRVLDSPVCKGGTGFWSCE